MRAENERGGDARRSTGEPAAGDGTGRRTPDLRWVGRGLVPAALLLLVAARPVRGPRSIDQIEKTLALGPHAGVCETCHTMHSANALPQDYLLKRPDDNALCDECHETTFTPGVAASYGGSQLYLGSTHGSSFNVIWPGPDPKARTEVGASGKCVNCHDPHGWTDSRGLIPYLAIGREEQLCLTCHDGSPASDIRTDIQLKSYSHPTTLYSDRHTGPGESQPSDFGVAPANRRHAECVDCHNPHVARSDGVAPPVAPDASKRLLGVSRVIVQNGAPGVPPSYTFVTGSDSLSAPVTEYQLCFKCHSSWTSQPGGQSDLALLLNPANASYHPVEAAGKDPTILSGAFEASWSATSLVECSDCHRSDSPTVRGPHGSLYAHILPGPYDASPNPRDVASDEACFSCHRFPVYGDSTSSDAVLAQSRFNKPALAEGHAGHSALRVPCGACHTTHGSATQPHLIVTGRNPGLLSITWSPTGGTCTSTCHDVKSYTVNYGR